MAAGLFDRDVERRLRLLEDAAELATPTVLDARYVALAGGVLLTDTVQTFATATPADITWSSEIYDPDGWIPAGGATLTVPAGKAGRYLISYIGNWSAAPGTTPGISCIINGTIGISPEATGVPAFASFSQTITFIFTLSVGTTLKFQGFHNAGSNRDLVSRLEIAPI
jgi:hypothetical protein